MIAYASLSKETWHGLCAQGFCIRKSFQNTYDYFMCREGWRKISTIVREGFWNTQRSRLEVTSLSWDGHGMEHEKPTSLSDLTSVVVSAYLPRSCFVSRGAIGWESPLVVVQGTASVLIVRTCALAAREPKSGPSLRSTKRTVPGRLLLAVTYSSSPVAERHAVHRQPVSCTSHGST